MKAKPVVTTALAVALCGGLLLAFPTLWMFLLLVLLGLVALQAAIVLRNLRIITRDAAGTSFRITTPPVMHVPAAGAPKPVQDVSSVLNRELFSRFRQHLETAESSAQAPTAKAPATGTPPPAALRQPPPTQTRGPESAPPEHLVTDGVADRVAISGAAKAGSAKLARRQAYPPAPPPKPPATPPEAEEDWFADLRPKLPGAVRKSETAPPPPPSPESAVHAGQDEEAATLLKLAEEGLQRDDLTAAKAAFGHYLSLMDANGAVVPWNARRVQCRLAALEQDAAGAIDAFEAMLKVGFEVKEENVPALLEQMTAGCKPEIGEPLRVSMLLRILAVFRQNKDRAAMDRLYRLVEDAQEKVGDERKLVQFLKNHLEIKKVMGDTAGQLELIDQIGNRLFKLGETAEAREYYEMGLKLRAELKQTQPAAEARPGTTQSA
jgi:hypothetical protein